VLAAIGFGLCTALAGWSRNVWLVLLFLTLSGCCDQISGLFRSALWNQTIPDELRGRLAGIELLSFSAGPQLGQIRAGTAAALTSVRTALWSGGLLGAAAVGLLALVLREMMAYDAETDEHAQQVRKRRTAETAEGTVPLT
jgi:MFS family permease